MKKTILSILLFGIMVIGITGCGTEEGNYEENDNKAVIQDTKGNVDDYYIEIKSYTLSKNTDDKDIVIVDLDWTNNSDETTAFIYTSFYYQAFQNGNELEDLATYGENEYDYDGYNLKDLEVAPGNTKSIRIAYLLENKTDDVEFKITDSDEEEIVSRTFKIN